MSGKGSAPRPIPDWDSYSENFDRIFGGKKVSYTETFEAETKEAAVALAESFVKTIDTYASPHVWGTYSKEDKWYATVRWYNID
jgi:hypothetical protein